jgi:hypothetical protein
MATSSTLSIFVPEVVGGRLTQHESGVTIATSKTEDLTQSRIFPDSGTPISDLTIKGWEPSTGNTRTTFNGDVQNVSFRGNSSDNNVTILGESEDLRLDLGGGNDNLTSSDIGNASISMGMGDDSMTTGDLKDSFVTFGGGNDEAVILGDTISTTLSMGSGDDTLVFGGDFRSSQIDMGEGADEIDFTSMVENAMIELGGDEDLDIIAFNSAADIGSGVVISGAGDGDLLLIGGEEYVFNSDEGLFISSDNDTITFG